jgi:hypothetical protein
MFQKGTPSTETPKVFQSKTEVLAEQVQENLLETLWESEYVTDIQVYTNLFLTNDKGNEYSGVIVLQCTYNEIRPIISYGSWTSETVEVTKPVKIFVNVVSDKKSFFYQVDVRDDEVAYKLFKDCF